MHTERKRSTLEIWEVVVTNDGKEQTLYFTSAEAPVTFMGHQYIPLSIFDQVKIAKLCEASDAT